jgi:hypothetical protein
MPRIGGVVTLLDSFLPSIESIAIGEWPLALRPHLAELGAASVSTTLDRPDVVERWTRVVAVAGIRLEWARGNTPRIGAAVRSK